MNKHVLIFLEFNNVDDIKKSFESMYLPDIDYFIIENKSGYSEEIKNYFLEEKKTRDNIVKYIQYEKNIAAVAVNIAIRDYADFFKQYAAYQNLVLYRFITCDGSSITGLYNGHILPGGLFAFSHHLLHHLSLFFGNSLHHLLKRCR